MSDEEFREMLHARPFRRFLIKTTDGDTWEVEHPDFAMISPVGTDVAVYDREGHLRIVNMNHIVSLEPVKSKNGRGKGGRR